MPNRIYVIEERCIGCGKCVPACPVGPECLYMIDKPHGRWKKLAVINEDKCIFCNACVAVCDELYLKTKEKTGAEDMFKAIVMEKEEVARKVEIDISLYKDVWVFVEVRRGVLVNAGLELLSIGRKLAEDLEEKLCGVLIGYNVKKYADEVIKHGADVVYVIDDKIFENFLDEPYTYAVSELIYKYKPNKFLFPATSIGRSFSSRVAATVKTGLTADATELEIDKKTKML
ncbi:MAG: 4Fe-4S binding protein, partial [bacterium]|nr:4Fe-4S binding protein [bacterium]